MSGYVLLLFCTVAAAAPFTVRAPHGKRAQILRSTFNLRISDAIFGLDSPDFSYEILDLSSIERAVKNPPVMSMLPPTSAIHTTRNDALTTGGGSTRVFIITDAGLTAVASRASIQSAVDSVALLFCLNLYRTKRRMAVVSTASELVQSIRR